MLIGSPGGHKDAQGGSKKGVSHLRGWPSNIAGVIGKAT